MYLRFTHEATLLIITLTFTVYIRFITIISLRRLRIYITLTFTPLALIFSPLLRIVIALPYCYIYCCHVTRYCYTHIIIYYYYAIIHYYLLPLPPLLESLLFTSLHITLLLYYCLLCWFILLLLLLSLLPLSIIIYAAYILRH